MCQPTESPYTCFNCARATKKLDDDDGHCRKCKADDKKHGPFSRHQRRKPCTAPAATQT